MNTDKIRQTCQMLHLLALSLVCFAGICHGLEREEVEYTIMKESIHIGPSKADTIIYVNKYEIRGYGVVCNDSNDVIEVGQIPLKGYCAVRTAEHQFLLPKEMITADANFSEDDLLTDPRCFVLVFDSPFDQDDIGTLIYSSPARKREGVVRDVFDVNSDVFDLYLVKVAAYNANKNYVTDVQESFTQGDGYHIILNPFCNIDERDYLRVVRPVKQSKMVIP